MANEEGIKAAVKQQFVWAWKIIAAGLSSTQSTEEYEKTPDTTIAGTYEV